MPEGSKPISSSQYLRQHNVKRKHAQIKQPSHIGRMRAPTITIDYSPPPPPSQWKEPPNLFGKSPISIPRRSLNREWHISCLINGASTNALADTGAMYQTPQTPKYCLSLSAMNMPSSIEKLVTLRAHRISASRNVTLHMIAESAASLEIISCATATAIG